MKYSVFFFFITIELSTGLSGSFICTDKTTGTSQCCYNYEEVDGKCRACKPGSSSIGGGRCQPCERNKYGSKCLETCDCNTSQRCDPELGCVYIVSVYTINSITYTDIEDVDITEALDVSRGTGTVTETNGATGNNNNVLSTREWVVYTLGISTLTFIIIITHFIRTYKSSQKKSNSDSQKVQQEIRPPSQVNGIYDEIDESINMVDLKEVIKSEILNDVDSIKSEVDSDSQPSEFKDNASYLIPYLAKEDHRLNDERNSDGDNSDNSSTSNNSLKTDRGYFNSYQSLLDKSHDRSHDYEVAVVVHRINDDFSKPESENDVGSNFCLGDTAQLLTCIDKGQVKEIDCCQYMQMDGIEIVKNFGDRDSKATTDIRLFTHDIAPYNGTPLNCLTNSSREAKDIFNEGEDGLKIELENRSSLYSEKAENNGTSDYTDAMSTY